MAVAGDKAENQLREITECPICMSTFSDPRMLSCIHTFCYECLKSTGEAEQKKPGDKMFCPLCRKEFIIPPEGIIGLKRNFFMENFLEFKATLQSNLLTLTIGTEIKEEVKKEEVKRMSNVKYCNQHNQRLLDYYCAECKIVVCVSCFVESHKLHDCKDVATVEENVRQTISRAAWKASNYADEMLSLGKNAEVMKTDFLMKLQQIEMTINKRNQDLKDLIDKHTNSLLDELTAIKSKNQKEMETRLEEIDRCYTILSSFESYCTEITLKGSASDICSSVDQLIARADELEKDRKAFLGRPNISVDVSFQTRDAGDVLQNANENLIGHVEVESVECNRLSSVEMNAQRMLWEQMNSPRMSLHEMNVQRMSSDQTHGQKTSSDPIQWAKFMQDADRNCVECDVCKEGDPDDIPVPIAAKHCTECEQNLCSRCSNDHRRQKLLKDHHIIDIPCQMEAEPNRTNPGCNREPIPEVGHHSANVFQGYLQPIQMQHQTSGTDVLSEFERERDRYTEYDKEMSDYIDQLFKKQDDTSKTAGDIRQIILDKYSECVARLQRDKNALLQQLDSHTKKILSVNGTNLREAISYVEKLRDRKKYFEPETIKKRPMETNDKLDRSLLLHVHFQRPIQSLDNVSFDKSFACTEEDNTIGRIEGLTNISMIQTAPTLDAYMMFLRSVHSRTADAWKLHWKLTILNEVELESLYEMNFLQGVHDELDLSRADKKRDELQKRHTRLATFLFEATRPTYESSSEIYENHLTELQHVTEEIWNTIQFHIHYKNSEKGLKPEGFQNFGNTCYFNSVFQCLVQTVLLPFELTLNLYSLGNVLTNKEEMSRAFMELTSNYKICEQRKEALMALYNKFIDATPRFNDQKQHVCHDFMINYLEKLKIEERNDRHEAETQKTLTAVDRIFGGQFITVYICHSCEDPYATRVPFLDISIPLCTLTTDQQRSEDNKSKPTNRTDFVMFDVFTPERISVWRHSRNEETASRELDASDSESQQKPMMDDDRNKVDSQPSCETKPYSSSTIDGSKKEMRRKEIIRNMLQPLTKCASTEPETKTFWSRWSITYPNVSQCLNYFTRAEEMVGEYLCRNCQLAGSEDFKTTSATRRTLIFSPPAVLVLHLKRFEQSSSGFVKRDEMISYDELLDLGPFCSSSALRIDPEEENVWYSLYGVVVHSGLSLSKGHYVAYVKQRDSSVLLDDQLREKFLQKNFVVGNDVVPNYDDLATLEKRKAIKKREKAKPPNPISGQWFYISDDSVRPCDEKEALSQKAYLLFYERIPGTDGKSMGV